MNGDPAATAAVAPAGDAEGVRAAAAGIATLLGRSVVPRPDLVLLVVARDGGAYAVSVTDGAGNELLEPERADALSRPGGAQPILDRFRTVLLKPRAEWEGAVAELGEQLWDLLPPGMQRLYWRAVHGKNLSVLVSSDEPSMPWELIKPRPGPNGETALMFGRAFSMTRWNRKRDLPDSLAATGFAAVAPAYNGRRLPGASAEIGTLASRYGARDIGDTFDVLGAELRSPALHALHFSGHGTFDPNRPEEGQLVLRDRPLRLEDVRDVDFRRGERPPLVFLNACQVGGQGWSSAGVGGWAAMFGDAGASVFVGPYWSVNSQIASLAALQFYEALETKTLGEAMRAVRERFATDARARFHPTWLAYTVHGHPNATVRFGQGI